MSRILLHSKRTATALIGVAAVMSAAVLVAAAPASSSLKGKTLCVGGPHCYASVQAALNAASDGDTIAIGPGSFAGGITITKSITLSGVAAAASRIVGGGPVVTIGSAATKPTVSIARVTITGGLATSNPQTPACGPDVPVCGPGYADSTALGGGVEAFPGSTVTLLNDAVTGNRSTPAHSTTSVKATCPGDVPCSASFGDAAGIDNWGTMTLIGTSVSNNRASAVQSNGGGIVDEANATLVLERSQVTGNSANGAAPSGRFVDGGGILVAGGGTLTVDASSIDGNSANLTTAIPHPYPLQDGGTDQANAVGGGIYLGDGSSATIRNSSLDGNAVSVSDSFGEPFGADAALCACGGVDLTIQNSTVDGNSLTVNVLSSADSGPSGPTALEADASASITGSHIDRNTAVVTTPHGDAGTLGAIAFFLDGDSASIANSTVVGNTSIANAPTGAATIQGAGISNNGPLTLTNDVVSLNRGAANGKSGAAQGAGIWNGVLFGGPASPLSLHSTLVTGNALTGGPVVSLQGGGIFTPGFPATFVSSVVVHNTPDNCFGC